MSSLARKLRRNKAKKDFKKNNQDMSFSDYWKFREGKPVEQKNTKIVYQQASPEPQPTPEELEQEKQRKESIDRGRAFLENIFNKKVEDLKANDEHGEHN